jgi:hypothetical protein
MEAMKTRVTEEGKTAQENFTNAMKTLFRAPKGASQNKNPKPKKASKQH